MSGPSSALNEQEVAEASVTKESSSSHEGTGQQATGSESRSGAAAPAEAGEWVCVGHASRFGGRTNLKVHSRLVTVLRLKARGGAGEKWACMDTICYHAGGPLAEGAVERVAGRTCVRCPWHSYLVDIESGEGLYMDLGRRWRSKGVRQRVHEVERRGDGHVWVRLGVGEKVASDEYAYGPRFAGRGGEGVVGCFPE